jgi:hypothetical protein
MATDKVIDNDTPLATISVFESYDYHAVTLQAAAPALMTVLSLDDTTGNERCVAGSTYVVVTVVAFWAVESGS